MLAESPSSERPLPWERKPAVSTERGLHLVLVWSLDEPERIGEVVQVEGTICLGRGVSLADDPAPRCALVRMRPGSTEARSPITSSRIARLQLVLSRKPRADSLEVRSLGASVMRVNGHACTTAELRAGDVVEIHNAAVFFVSDRPKALPPVDDDLAGFAFGSPDPFGIVGESEGAWRLRSELAFAASTDRHVLLLGESGAGKELAASMIHGRSSRRARPLVSRNAATMPESLLDAELFGNVKNYPNPGMPERLGLVGEAHESTLLLDEIGELPEQHQVHLLRVLDADGEYQRLGESKTRRSSLRLIAATNRSIDALKPDFLARFTHRITVGGLDDRREDIPLLVATLLARIADRTPSVAAKFFERRAGKIAEPRLAPHLIVRLMRHSFTHHVRELDRLLWLSIGTAQADFIGMTPAVEAELDDGRGVVASASMAPGELDRSAIQKALDDSGRSPSKAAKALGLKNRYVLLRLLKKHGISVTTTADDEDGQGGAP